MMHATPSAFCFSADSRCECGAILCIGRMEQQFVVAEKLVSSQPIRCCELGCYPLHWKLEKLPFIVAETSFHPRRVFVITSSDRSCFLKAKHTLDARNEFEIGFTVIRSQLWILELLDPKELRSLHIGDGDLEPTNLVEGSLRVADKFRQLRQASLEF